MAGSIVVTTTEISHNINRYRLVWTSDASGDVNGNTFPLPVGTILAVDFIPGTGGSAPTALYDVDMLNDLSISLFDDGAGTSVGSNLSATLATHRVPLIGLLGVQLFRRWFRGGQVQLTVAGAGDTKSGTVDIYFAYGVL